MSALSSRRPTQRIPAFFIFRIARSRRLSNITSFKLLSLLGIFVFLAMPCTAQSLRKVIVDQDARGPATTDQQSILMFLQAPNVETLGITIVSGDMWRDEEVAHTLRMLELTGHTDIPVVPGAIYPLINRMEVIERWETLYGKVHYQGAWNGHKPGMNLGEGLRGKYHQPDVVPDLAEGNPTIKPSTEDAAHFIIRMVHKYPHQVTIYAGGPLTNIAQAISIDPQVSELAQELVVMGGALAAIYPAGPPTELRREFNFWWDPESVHMTLTAPWHKITITTVDISIKTRMTKAYLAELAKIQTPAAQYVAKYGDEEFMWDELAVAGWLDPGVITKESRYFMDIDISHTANYGNVLLWDKTDRPGLGEQLVNLPEDLDREAFYQMFLNLMARPSPAHSPSAPH
jgi:inosine-uridine nucleoside N-ribohydrolase